MSKILQREIQYLEQQLLGISSLAEGRVYRAIKSFEDRDIPAAEKVIADDLEIDRREVELEEACLKVLALHQPVAGDLRFIVALLKINNDLERVGDLATTVARRAISLARGPEVNAPFDLHRMAECAWSMVHDSLTALVDLDRDAARGVCAADKEVDAIHRRNLTRLEEAIRSDLPHLACYLAYMRVSRALERIADHATNIAEDVLYMLDGEIIRHEKKRGETSGPKSDGAVGERPA